MCYLTNEPHERSVGIRRLREHPIHIRFDVGQSANVRLCGTYKQYNNKKNMVEWENYDFFIIFKGYKAKYIRLSAYPLMRNTSIFILKKKGKTKNWNPAFHMNNWVENIIKIRYVLYSEFSIVYCSMPWNFGPIFSWHLLTALSVRRLIIQHATIKAYNSKRSYYI